MNITETDIGNACKRWRLAHGYTQTQVALETGYKQSNISKFENGGNDNMKVLMWYIKHGFNPLDELRGLLYGRSR